MGVQIGKLIHGKEIELQDMRGKKIGIDAFNFIFQFLSIIRDRETGEPLRNSKGQVTSHLSGIFYRTANILQAGVKPVWVFDGKPPGFKAVIEERAKAKKEAQRRLEEAREKGDIEEIRIAAQQTAVLTDEMLEQAKQLLELMGVPVVQAPSEADAQIAYMAKNKSINFAASQDWDILLFGSPFLVRNLSISGRRKVPRKQEYIQIKPELIELKSVLNELGINQEQLILIGILIGTDFNPGIKGVGPKRALELVKEQKTLKNVLSSIDWNSQFEDDKISAQEILDFFKNPPVEEKFKLKWLQPDSDVILKFMVDEFEFSGERIEKAVRALEQSKVQQSSLGDWTKK